LDFRDIDNLVCTEVMKWEFRDSLGSWVDKLNEDVYIVADNNFSPSTRISDAWVVVNQFKNINIIKRPYGYCASVWIDDNHSYEIELASSAQLAICFVTLKAAGMDINETD
jgi:hypothetical protein